MRTAIAGLALAGVSLAAPQHTYTSCDVVKAWPCASTFRDNRDCDTYLPTSYIVYPTQTSTVHVLESTPAIYPYTAHINAQWPAVTTTQTSLPPGPTTETTVMYTHALPSSLSVCNDLDTLSSVCSCRGLFGYSATTVTPYSTTTVTDPGAVAATATRTLTQEGCQASDNYGYAPTSISWSYSDYVPWNFEEQEQADIDTAAECCSACYDPENPNSGCNYYRWENGGTLDNGGTCYLGLWMSGNTPACYNGDPREYPGPNAGARDGGLNGTSQFGFGPCLMEQPCYYDPAAYPSACPY